MSTRTQTDELDTSAQVTLLFGDGEILKDRAVQHVHLLVVNYS